MEGDLLIRLEYRTGEGRSQFGYIQNERMYPFLGDRCSTFFSLEIEYKRT